MDCPTLKKHVINGPTNKNDCEVTEVVHVNLLLHDAGSDLRLHADILGSRVPEVGEVRRPVLQQEEVQKLTKVCERERQRPVIHARYWVRTCKLCYINKMA